MTMYSRSISWMLSDDLVWEVLVHLPAKSLMRFKCVSKLWYSIIRNPNFAKRHSLHAGCFHGILLSQFLSNPYQSLDNPKRLSYLNSNDSNNPILMNCHQLTLEVPPDYVASTAIVKGLIGLYNYSSFALYNIATHEMVKLPTSPPCSVYKYHLGFDPINEVFKVLKICDNGSRVKSFIFTLGKGSDQTWRSIDPGPINYATCVRSLCINGTLYWIFSKDNTFLPDLLFLTTFHLNSETFETIPFVTIQRPGDSVCYFDHLAEISGSPALITFIVDYDAVKVDVWLMKNGSLTKQTPLWPKSVEWTGCRLLEIPRSLAYVTTLPTGEILFARKYPSVVLLKYDHIKNEFREFKLNGCYPSRFRNDGMSMSWKEICYHEDNIIALGPLMNK